MIIRTVRNESINLGDKPIYSLTVPYSKGPYSKKDNIEQHIRITEGCPNKCVYCAESWENGVKPIIYHIPKIERNKVKILDMNLMYKKECRDIIKQLGNIKVNNKVVHYELQCGIDWRFMDQKKADILKKGRFINIRFAWDYAYSDAYKIKDCLNYLTKAGYKKKNIQIFMVCNWKIPMYECLAKLRTISHWNVQVADCWFDNQVKPDIKPIQWSVDEIEYFKQECRAHNVRIRQNGIQTEWIKKQDKYQKDLTQWSIKGNKKS